MNNDKTGKIIAIAKFTLLIIFIIGIPAYMYFFRYDFISGFRTVDDIKDYLELHETASAFVYIGLQILQVIISFIPAQPFNLASGYIFAFWLGYALSITGTTIGTASTFYLSRILGKEAIYLFFGEKKITELIDNLNTKRALTVIFFIYLIPGLPKDPVGYAVGLSKVKFLPFLIISIIGRSPAMMVTVMVGSILAESI